MSDYRLADPSFYWAAGTTSGSQSFGVADQPFSVAYTLFVTMMGVLMNGMIIGSLASLVSSFNAASEAKNQKLEAIHEYLSYKRVPAKLRRNIMQYYHFLWNSVQVVPENVKWWGSPPNLTTCTHQFDTILLPLACTGCGREPGGRRFAAVNAAAD